MKNTRFGRSYQPIPPSSYGTVALVAMIALAFLLAWAAGPGSSYQRALILAPASVAQQPWTLLSYVLASAGGFAFIGTLFLCLWLWMIGQSQERDLGTPGLLILFAVATLIHSLLWQLGSMVVPGGAGVPLYGAYLPVAFMTMAWAARNAEQVISFMFALQLKAKWLALITVGAVLFSSGAFVPLMGFFAIAPLGLGWLWGQGRLPGIPYGRTQVLKSEGKKRDREFDQYRESVRQREKDREERERLRKLFESSLQDDDKK